MIFLWIERDSEPQNLGAKNGVFVSAYAYALSDLSAAFLNTTVPGPLPVFHCSVSHTKTRHSHTHGDGWAWPGHSARLRGVPVRESPAAVSQAAALSWLERGCGGWTWGQKGAGFQGDGRVGRELSGLFMQHRLYTTGMGGRVLARVGRPIQNTLWWWCKNKKKQLAWNGLHQLFLNPLLILRVKSFLKSWCTKLITNQWFGKRLF